MSVVETAEGLEEKAKEALAEVVFASVESVLEEATSFPGSSTSGPVPVEEPVPTRVSALISDDSFIVSDAWLTQRERGKRGRACLGREKAMWEEVLETVEISYTLIYVACTRHVYGVFRNSHRLRIALYRPHSLCLNLLGHSGLRAFANLNGPPYQR